MKIFFNVLWLTSVLWTLGGAEPVVAGTVYRWVDAEGKVSYADQPPARGASQYRESPQPVTLEELPVQNDSAATRGQLDANRRWFEQRARERQAQEAQRAREHVRQARADQQWQQRCSRAQQQLEQAERHYEVQRRTWLKPAAKARLKEKLASRRAEVKQRCD